MALVKCGNGIIDIRGSVSGNVFSKDKSGLHIQTHQRRIKSRSINQTDQRKAFTLARQYSKNEREVSYNIYRILNGLSPTDVPTDYPQLPFKHYTYG